MKELATTLGMDYAAPLVRTGPGTVELSGRWEILPNRDAVKVNRIRYPYPNRLGLIKPTPIAGRVIESEGRSAL
jgi:hypothetical protein